MPLFAQLWANHPTIRGDAPLLDPNAYPNQCAINLYAALERSGYSMSTFYGQMSWQKGKPRYAIVPRELAEWISILKIISSKRENFSGDEAFEKIDARRGVIFFKNCWGLGHQGDHIDLWNGNRLTRWTSWPRVNFNISWEGHFSNFRNSETAWFWEMP